MSKKLISVIVCIIALVVVIGILQWKSSYADQELVQATETQTDTVTTDDVAEEQVQGSVPPATFFNVDPTGGLSVGAMDAPITLLEFSSLSCPHCATFHNSILAPIKKDYIDTGKVRIVFMDFPLNRQALDGTLLTRCVDLENRYEFMNMLFEQQAQWAFENDHRDKLVQYASLVGLNRDKALSCMNDGPAERVLLENMRSASNTFSINSTPTFIVLPGEQKIPGAQNYGVFSQVFERLLSAE